ncbi:hypothetical protein RRG08_030149 [Elysia crispata]|uniref:Uncharacterized protein n=1 Tax=Elysia crispata TaxID=231223 RepID=A0AAE0ZRK3_9GAST|nr:hypothetical protein RRG08_030149 [Elysia crispata]
MTREDARGTWPPRPPSAQSSVKQDVLHSGVGPPRVVGPASYQAGGTVCSVTAETCALALINVGGKKNKNGCIKNMFDNEAMLSLVKAKCGFFNTWDIGMQSELEPKWFVLLSLKGNVILAMGQQKAPLHGPSRD